MALSVTIADSFISDERDLRLEIIHLMRDDETLMKCGCLKVLANHPMHIRQERQ